MKFEPQEGPQTSILETSADVAFYGGAAGGGKTFSLFLESLRNIRVKDFKALFLRRTIKQIKEPGALWDESLKVYQHFDGEPIESRTKWKFPYDVTVSFSHIEHLKNIYDYQGAQIPLIMFDELTHFTRKMFLYLLSRNRSTCGITPYIRCTCNADASSWVRKFIDWYINDDGFANPDRVGKIRYFINVNDKIHWANRREDLYHLIEDKKAAEQYGQDVFIKSFTFINSTIFDNKILLEKDPQYLANLNALDRVERERLKNGNWNIVETAGEVFQRSWFEIVEACPSDGEIVRYWDRAATKPKNENHDPDWTVGVKMRRASNGIFYVDHVERFRESPFKVKENIKNIANSDGKGVTIILEQDPGQAGVAEVQDLVRHLVGYDVRINKVNKDKVTRAKPSSAQAEAGNIKLIEGQWNDDFMTELENFPEGSHDDQVDAFSGALNHLSDIKRPRFRTL
jgi:predicted phage terminase large subunit-like protein